MNDKWIVMDILAYTAVYVQVNIFQINAVIHSEICDYFFFFFSLIYWLKSFCDELHSAFSNGQLSK